MLVRSEPLTTHGAQKTQGRVVCGGLLGFVRFRIRSAIIALLSVVRAILVVLIGILGIIRNGSLSDRRDIREEVVFRPLAN